MRVLITGSGGFIGSNIADLLSASHKVVRSARQPGVDVDVVIDLMDSVTVRQALLDVQPEAIIQCAGVVGDDRLAELNPKMTANMLDQVTTLKIKPKIVICGSAAEYGIVKQQDIPVKEDTTLNAQSPYGLSKVNETRLALKARQQFGLPLTVARLFNPVGKGMNPKLSVPNIISQARDVKVGKRRHIEVSRLDSRRDYFDVRDLAEAFKAIIEGSPKHDIYNIGSGKSTSNDELMKLVLGSIGLKETPPIIEKLKQPEPLVAIKADIYVILGDQSNNVCSIGICIV